MVRRQAPEKDGHPKEVLLVQVRCQAQEVTTKEKKEALGEK